MPSQAHKRDETNAPWYTALLMELWFRLRGWVASFYWTCRTTSSELELNVKIDEIDIAKESWKYLNEEYLEELGKKLTVPMKKAAKPHPLTVLNFQKWTNQC